MASVVDICNLALARLGDEATVSSIDPPEGSAQAEHCARFYPIARDTLLEAHQWTFCTKRATPAVIDAGIVQWQYAYAAPADLIDIISVMNYQSSDDFSQPLVIDNQVLGSTNSGMGTYAPQPYSLETLDDGTSVILTNQENALIRYTARITDTTKFPSQFVDALAWLLASYLAGPIMKGDVGVRMGQACYQAYIAAFRSASTNDANNQRRNINQSVSWMVNR